MFAQITPAVKRLLILNAAILFLSSFLFPSMDNRLALHYVHSSFFFPTQFFTYMFMHADMWHLFSNMIGLLVFGNLLERFWGSKRFLIFYLITGIGAGLMYWAVQFYQMQLMQSSIETYSAAPTPQSFNAFMLDYPAERRQLMQNGFIDEYDEAPSDPTYIARSIQYMRQMYEEHANVPMVGASGAIFGILMAFGLLFPNTELLLLFPPMPIKAKYLVIFYGAYEIWALHGSPGDNVAHLAHLGGLLIGFIMVRYWQRNSKKFY